MATLIEIEKLLDAKLRKQKEEIVQSLDARVREMETRFNDKLGELEEKLFVVEARLMRKEEELQSFKKECDTLKRDLDDQINRSMRTTLVFKGINEEENEKAADTATILGQVIARHTDVKEEDARKMIERAHRGGKRQHVDGGKKVRRPIFVKIDNWQNSELLKSEFLKLKLRNKAFVISVDQMYSPALTERRNEALKCRKELLSAGTIAKGHLVYPANLLVKYKVTDKHYISHRQF